MNSKIDNQSVIARINEAKDCTGFSVYQLAKESGLDGSNLKKQMNGQVGFSHGALSKIARALNVSLDWLKTGEGEMYEQRPMSAEEMMQVTNRYGMHVVGDNAVQNNGTAASSVTVSLEAEVAALKARLEEKDKQIEMLLGLLRSNTNK